MTVPDAHDRGLSFYSCFRSAAAGATGNAQGVSCMMVVFYGKRDRLSAGE